MEPNKLERFPLAHLQSSLMFESKAVGALLLGKLLALPINMAVSAIKKNALAYFDNL